MLENGDTTVGEKSFIAPLCVTLGADHGDTPHVVGQVAQLVGKKRNQAANPLNMLYFNIGDGMLAGQMADAIRSRMPAQSIRISGTEQNEQLLPQAQSLLKHKSALGVLHALDPSNSPAVALRNRLECVGGADMLVYAHGAYPGRLPAFKLSRMVERLGDLIAPHGAVVTLHNHGISDVDTIRKQVLGLAHFSAPGLHCNTQHKLESAFGAARLHSFSVIVPNYLELPANLLALEAIFEGADHELDGQDADDAEVLRRTLEQVAGGKEVLEETLQEADAVALEFFRDRITGAEGKSMPITLGGGQMVMAFHSLEMAQAAFAAMQEAARHMDIPAIVLPIDRAIAPELNAHATHSEWKQALQKRGIIQPPEIAQLAAQRQAVGGRF